MPREPVMRFPVTQPAPRICILLHEQSPIKMPSTYTCHDSPRRRRARPCVETRLAVRPIVDCRRG